MIWWCSLELFVAQVCRYGDEMRCWRRKELVVADSRDIYTSAMQRPWTIHTARYDTSSEPKLSCRNPRKKLNIRDDHLVSIQLRQCKYVALTKKVAEVGELPWDRRDPDVLLDTHPWFAPIAVRTCPFFAPVSADSYSDPFCRWVRSALPVLRIHNTTRSARPSFSIYQLQQLFMIHQH